MICEFRENDHTYWLDGKRLISVTQLLRKHGLTEDYGYVGEEVLRAKAAYGQLVHEEIKEYTQNGTIGMSAEFVDYLRLIAQTHVKPIKVETIVNNDIVAGTYDMLAMDKDGYVLIDHKTTAKLNKEALAWQLGLYNYLGEHKANKFYAFHLLPNGKSRAVEITPKSTDEIEKLLQAERDGQIYHNDNLLVVDKKKIAQLAQCEQKIAQLKEQISSMEETRKALYAILVNAMENASITNYESDLLDITYVAPYTRATIDATSLRKDYPDIAEKYAKKSFMSASVRVKLKCKS